MTDREWKKAVYDALAVLRLALPAYGRDPKSEAEAVAQAKLYASSLDQAGVLREALGDAVRQIAEQDREFPVPARLIDVCHEVTTVRAVRVLDVNSPDGYSAALVRGLRSWSPDRWASAINALIAERGYERYREPERLPGRERPTRDLASAILAIESRMTTEPHER